MSFDANSEPAQKPRRTLLSYFLDGIEWLGNKLPDPVVLFLGVLLTTWVVSALLSPVEFTEIDPRTIGKDASGQLKTPQPIRVKNLLTSRAMADFLSNMVRDFAGFPPLGLVLVSMLGVGVAQHVGLIDAMFKGLLKVTPAKALTPVLLIVSVVGHTAGDTAFVTVVPLGGVIFAAAGRHPLTGIACAFAGVAGGFTANVLPSGLDALLQGFTEPAAQIINPTYKVNTVCNYYLMIGSSVLIVLAGWYVTERITEPRLRAVVVDGDPADMPKMEPLTPAEKRGLIVSLATFLLMATGLAAAVWPIDSPLRGPGGSLAVGSPLINSVIPLLFLFSLVPGIAYGYGAGTVKNHRDVVKGMTRGMTTLSYYIVLAFFAALFTSAFRESNLGALLAIKGAAWLQSLNLPPQSIIVGVIVLTTLLDLLIASASAKWALLSPIFVPMLMSIGLSPELTQAAFRIGDSPSNIITPLLPYFPLVLVYSQRYVKKTGIGTLVSLMLPYYLVFLPLWALLLLGYWQFEVPLGPDVSYYYTP